MPTLWEQVWWTNRSDGRWKLRLRESQARGGAATHQEDLGAVPQHLRHCARHGQRCVQGPVGGDAAAQGARTAGAPGTQGGGAPGEAREVLPLMAPCVCVSRPRALTNLHLENLHSFFIKSLRGGSNKVSKNAQLDFKYFYFLLFINGKFEDKALTVGLNFN